MGLGDDLNLKGNEFSNIATFLFVGLLCFEIPNGKCPNRESSNRQNPLAKSG
jgi:hypothetical protein